jgi:hypothetical protein
MELENEIKASIKPTYINQNVYKLNNQENNFASEGTLIFKLNSECIQTIYCRSRILNKRNKI